jgi:peptide chain release factor 1
MATIDVMVNAWDAIRARHQELETQLSLPGLSSQDRHRFQKEHSHLTTLLEQKRLVESLVDEREKIVQQLAEMHDAEMKQLYEQELVELQEKTVSQQLILDQMVAPPDEFDDRSVFLEIRAGTGGQEAALFASDLLRMYSNYGLNRGWHVKMQSESHTDLGGYREVVISIEGRGVYGALKHESGVHRVQRVPATETSGRVHTSTATIAVLPEAEEVDIKIEPSDLRIDVFRASGAGGQHVNTTDSAVRITHIPTGVVVSCQDERSQHKNKAKAMKILQSRILQAQKEEQDAAMSKQRKELVGTGMRAEKVRTYNYPQNRVTDHQADITLKNLDVVMEGGMGEIIDALIAREREVRKQRFIDQFVK